MTDYVTMIDTNDSLSYFRINGNSNDSIAESSSGRGGSVAGSCPPIDLARPVHVQRELFYVNTTFGIVAILGNGLSIVLLLRILWLRKETRNGSTISICVLAMSDFLQAVFVYPSIIQSQVHAKWYGGMAMCQFMAFTGNFYQLFSATIVTMLAVIRYLVLGNFSPHLFRVYIKKVSMWAAIILVMGVVTAIASALPFTNLGCIDFYPEAGVCSYSWIVPGKRRVSLYVIIGIDMVALLSTLICTIGTIAMLHRTPWKNKRFNVKRRSRERRISIGVIAIATVQLVCWGPMVVWMPIYYSGIVTDSKTVMMAYMVAGELLLGASVFNPFCFAIMMRQYRVELWSCVETLSCGLLSKYTAAASKPTPTAASTTSHGTTNNNRGDSKSPLASSRNVDATANNANATDVSTETKPRVLTLTTLNCGVTGTTTTTTTRSSMIETSL
ncbi:melatonin receptor type 1A-like [Tubulanus polymorphus]|uniref:melatonin receptor type 1A-like n=1 Tax=Tubulanus polymorphus TaxID=672921 RepID=UPI003DA6A183